jgi:hypothetical protein
LGKLKVCGEEEEELDFSAELDDLVKDVRWLALVRVHTTKNYSHAALMNNMRNAWSAAKETTFKVMGENLFLVQFNCLGDWTRVMDGGPWIFRGAPVVLEEYDGFSNIHEYKLDRIPVWIRIFGLPDGLTKNKELAERVAKKVGEKPIKVIVTEGKINPTPYLRARVFLKLDTPLVRFVSITFKEAKRYLVQYEKLPSFCGFCGLLGHEVSECGDGVHDVEACEWGDWLIVKFPSFVPNRTPRGRGGRGGRMGGRGRGFGDEDDMDFTYENPTFDERDGADSGKSLEQEDGQLPTSPEPAKEKKRPRSSTSQDSPDAEMATAASSETEGRRAQ